MLVEEELEEVQVEKALDEVQVKETLDEVQVEEEIDEVQFQEENVANIHVIKVPVVPHISSLLKRMRKRKSKRILKLKLGKRVGGDNDPRNSKKKILNID